MQILEGGPVDRAVGSNRESNHHLVGLAQGDAQDRGELLALLDQPDHGPGLITEVLGRLGQVQQAPERRRVQSLGGRTEHPEFEVVLHLVEAFLEMAHLGGQPSVTEHQGAVGQPDGRLRQVLHLDQYVDGPIQIGEGLAVLGSERLPDRSGGQFAQPGDPVARAVQEQHVTGNQHGLAIHIGDPLTPPAHRHDPHAGLHRQFEG